MNFILVFLTMASVSVHGMENQDYGGARHTQHSTFVYVSSECLPSFVEGLGSFLFECHHDCCDLQCSLEELWDPALIEKLPALTDLCREKFIRLKQKMDNTSFDRHPFFETVWQLGQTHPFPDQKIIVDTGWSRFRDVPNPEDEEKVIKELLDCLCRIGNKVRETLEDANSKATFFSFDEVQNIGLTVSPGRGISITWPQPNLMSPFVFEKDNIDKIHDQLSVAIFDLSDMINMLALVDSVFFRK